MADPIDTGESERNVLAGEYALGVLEGEELVAAQRLALADRDFAEQVRWWNHRLACMAEAAGSIDPGHGIWPAIERRLQAPATDPFVPLTVARSDARRGFSGWSVAAAMSGAAAIAAVVTLFVATPQGGRETPGPAPTQQAGSRLVAQLKSEDGTISLAGLVEPGAARLTLDLAGLESTDGRAPELWVIPSDGVPRSLGEIPASGSFSRDLTEEERGLLVAGSALAVTYEDSASIPHSAPTGKILVAGGLAKV